MSSATPSDQLVAMTSGRLLAAMTTMPVPACKLEKGAAVVMIDDGRSLARPPAIDATTDAQKWRGQCLPSSSISQDVVIGGVVDFF
jgi:hypothetical protein